MTNVCTSAVNYVWCPKLNVIGQIAGYTFFGTSYNLPVTARDPAWWLNKAPYLGPADYTGATAGFTVYNPQLSDSFKSIYFGYTEGDVTVPILTYGSYAVESPYGQSYNGTISACSKYISTTVIITLENGSVSGTFKLTVNLTNVPNDKSNFKINILGITYTTYPVSLIVKQNQSPVNVVISFDTGGNPQTSSPPIYNVNINLSISLPPFALRAPVTNTYTQSKYPSIYTITSI